MVEYKLDAKDKKLLDILQKNSRLPYSTIAKKAGLIRETAYYRILNLQKQGIIKKFVTYFDLSKFGLEVYSAFISLNTASLEIRERIKKALSESSFVSWAASIGNSFDFAFAIQAKDVSHFRALYSELTEPFQQYIQEEQFSHRSRLEIQTNYNLVVKKSEKSNFDLLSNEKRVEIDDLDKKIIGLLSEDSRIGLVDIETKLKVPFSTIQARIRRLEQRRIILGYSILIDYTKLSLDINQLLLITRSVNEKDNEKIRSFCKNNSSVIYNLETFAPWSNEITIVSVGNLELQEFINKLRELLSDKLKEIKILPTFDYYIKFKSLVDLQ